MYVFIYNFIKYENVFANECSLPQAFEYVIKNNGIDTEDAYSYTATTVRAQALVLRRNENGNPEPEF